MRRMLAAAALLAALAPAAVRTAQFSWLHVQIENEGGEDEGLHVPLAAISALLALAPNTVLDNGQLRLGAEYLPALRATRAVWGQLEAAGEGEPVSAEHEGARVRVARAGGRLEVEVDDGRGRTAQGDLPAPVAEALLSGADDALHIDAALDALRSLRGEAIRVAEPHRRIRIWIDDTPRQ